MRRERRRVAQVIEPQEVLEGAGVKLKRSIAGAALNYHDPFLLFDHFGSDDPQDYLAGFPMHPHRGIETVTYMLSGSVNHKDSLGNAGTIGGGDMQWMTAGGGILHEEMPKSADGKMEGFQLWVNLPARSKMRPPRYQEVSASNIPEVVREDGTTIKVVAGEIDGTKGPVTEIEADPVYLDVTLPPGVPFVQDVPRGHAGLVYVFRGTGEFGLVDGAGETVSGPTMIVLGDGEAVEARGGSESVRFLVMSGLPLHEPIARYGPFVMNTKEEIDQALRDLRDGTFVYGS
jgi:redox-sensitive bicupin YhaK (pirin superfamily)